MCLSVGKFDALVKDGRMPRPKKIDRRLVWDVRALDAAADDLRRPARRPSTKPGQTSMPRKLPPNTNSFQSKGKRVIYFRIGKNPRTCRLPDDPDSEEFRIAYADAMAGQIEPKRPKLKEPEPGTIAALVTSYMRSAAYRSLRATTKKGYQTRIEIFREKHGHRTVSGLTRERINVAILQPYADRPGQALSLLKMLRVLVRHAIDIGMLRHNPDARNRAARETREIRAWTEGEIAKFERHWPIGTNSGSPSP